VKNCLEFNDLEKCLDGSESDAKKLKKAKNILSLSVDSTIYVHIQSSKALLAGLTEDFRPLVLGIESSGTQLTGDSIISKLIDSQANTEKDSAFFGKKKKGKQTPCRNCGKPWSTKHKCEKGQITKKNTNQKNSITHLLSSVVKSVKLMKTEVQTEARIYQLDY